MLTSGNAWLRAVNGSMNAGTTTEVVDGVRTALVGHGDDELTIVAWLPRPTDLGWYVVQAGLKRYGGPGPIASDAPEFDALIEAVAPPDVVDPARSLLGPEVREVLLRMVRVGRPMVTDTVVALEVSTMDATLDEITARRRWCVEAAGALSDRAAALPAHPALVAGGHAEALRRVAAERGMSLRRNALCVDGALPTMDLELALRATDGAWVGRVDSDLVAAPAGWALRARFREPLGAGLAVRPASALDRAKDLVGLGDLRVGDADFDRAWTITAAAPNLARAMLTPDARGLLGRLTAMGLRLALDDAGVAGRGPLPPSAEAASEVLWCLEGLRDALRPRSSGGAYR